MTPRRITYITLLGLIPVAIYTLSDHSYVFLALVNVAIIFLTLFLAFTGSASGQQS